MNDEIGKTNATITVTGFTGPYDGIAHGATGTATGAGGEVLTGLDLGASFTEVPGGTANWTFTDVTGNYNNASGTASIIISTAGATISLTGGGSFDYDGAPHGASGFTYGVGGPSDIQSPDLTFSYAGVSPTVYPPSTTAPTNAGTYEVTASFAGNANYTATSANATITINKASATFWITADNKVYDGNDDAVIPNSGVSGLVSDLDVIVTSKNGRFSDKNAGTNKIVTADIEIIGGTNVNNYTINSTASTIADITPKLITGNFTAGNKPYDGNNIAVVLIGSLNGIIYPDVVYLSGGTATFDNPTIGNNKPVTLTGAILTGADGPNYSLTSVGTTIANITPASLTIAAVNRDKVYGQVITLNTASGSSDYTVTGLVAGDLVSSITLTSDGAPATAPVGTYRYNTRRSSRNRTREIHYLVCSCFTECQRKRSDN